MIKDALPKGQTIEPPKKEEEQKPQMISVEEILGGYPLDRDKCRDVITLEISRSLIRIANSLEAITQGMVVINTHLNDLKRGNASG